jgi:hypothetical protein
MRVFLGVILGIVLTVGAAFAYDSATGRVPNGLSAASTASGQAPMVNWDVVNANWHGIEALLRSTVADIEREWKRLTG